MFDQTTEVIIAFHARGFLTALIWGLVWSTVLLILLMIIHKLSIENREKKFLKIKHRYLSGCYRHLADPGFQLKSPASQMERTALLDVIIFLLGEVRPEQHEELRRVAREFQLTGYFLQLAEKSSAWRNRIVAVEKLGFLSFPELAPFFQRQLLTEKDSHVKAKLLWGFSKIATADAAWQISRILASEPIMSAKFNVLLYWEIIEAFQRRGEAADCLRLINDLLSSKELPLLLKRDLVEACGAKNFREAAPKIRQLSFEYREEPMVQIACLRAIGSLGGDRDGELTRLSLSDLDWRVRAVAAKYAHLGPDSLLSRLAELLSDADYYVRLNAALALKGKGEEGHALLHQHLLKSDDVGRDICAYVLREA